MPLASSTVPADKDGDDDEGVIVHKADAHAADGVLADRELRDDLTDASRDRLGAEIDARRDRMLL